LNIFNRVVIVLLVLMVIAVSVIAIVNEFTGYFKWSTISFLLFDPNNNIPAYISVTALFAVIAVCILVLVFEFRRKKERIARVNSVQSGKAMITLDTISQQIKDSVLRTGGLKNLRVNILPKSGGVIIDMVAEMSQNMDISEKMSEVIKTAKSTASDKMKIKVFDTKLTITNLISDEKNAVVHKPAVQPDIQPFGQKNIEQKKDVQPVGQSKPANGLKDNESAPLQTGELTETCENGENYGADKL
jgi:hypothetical protein